MGSYDTSEVSTNRQRTYEPAVRETEEHVPEPVRETRRRSSSYDPGLKTIVALGGGLTPDRIVSPIPESVRDGSLSDVVQYLSGQQVASSSADRAVVEAVEARMRHSDYRIIVNDSLNLSGEKLQRSLSEYLYQRQQMGEDGVLKFNFADIAIVSHDEGGRPLEYLV